MISCAKCHTKFPIEINRITKGSMIACPNCGNECVVKLLDLENFSEPHKEEDSGFAGVEKIAENISKDLVEEEKNSPSSLFTKHFIITLLVIKLLLMGFIIGIMQIKAVNEKFPMLAKLYRSIDIIPRRTLEIDKIEVTASKVNDESYNLEITIKLHNTSDKKELLSDVSVIVFDAFNNVIAHSLERPYLIMKEERISDFKLKINAVGINARNLSVMINGKTESDSISISHLFHQKKLLM